MREPAGLSQVEADGPVELVEESDPTGPDMDPSSLPPDPEPVRSVRTSSLRVPFLDRRLTEMPGDSSEESEDSEEEDSSDTADLDRLQARMLARERAASKRRKNIRTIRKHGMIYVSEADWYDMKNWVENCHIVVVSPSMNAFVDKATKTMEDPHGGTPGASLNERCLSAEDEVLLSAVPLKFRIINELLRREMELLWPGKRAGFRYNCDHVAPFRSVTPYEEAFRRRHQELEDQFKLIAQHHPDHFAVTRKVDHVPPALSAYTNETLGTKSYRDDIDKARIILDGFRTLIKLLDTDLHTLVESYRCIDAGTAEALPFSHLSFLFTPGQEIIATRPKYQAYRVLQVTGGKRSLVPRKDSKSKEKTVSDLVIDCFYIDFDGNNFGPVPVTFSIRPYDDMRPIMALPVYPLSFHKLSGDEKMTKSLAAILQERGRKFCGFTGVSHCRYKGLSIRGEQPFNAVEEIDSEVIIDFELAYRNIPAPEFGGGVIDKPTEEDVEESREPGTTWEDNAFLKHTWSQWSQNTPLLRTQAPGTLSSDAYKLLPARVYGYVLLSRKWHPLDIDLINPVSAVKPGENDGFDKLVLPTGHRDIVRALVQTHARKADESGGAAINKPQREFDVVRGKGKGLIILLHGAPGVGKTSTAECVAANAGRPLFPITCGDLGAETAQEVEANLERFFDLARKWNCVLLLDEADVFLSARVEGNIRQNSLVSVFLRVLEYYSGILVLTTNRVGSFDEAIKSRVHCALYYPPLNQAKTFEVWKMNLDALETRNKALEAHQRVRFKRKEIEEYARDHWRSGKRANRWNGRQIKNAFQTAVALAEWDNLSYTGGIANPNGLLLKRDHFEKVAAASRHFDHYLATVRRADHVRVREGDLRDDNITNVLQFEPDTAEEEDDGEDEEQEEKSRKKGRAAKKTSSAKKSLKAETTKGSANSKSKGSSGKSRRHHKSETESEQSSSEESSSGSESSSTSDSAEASDNAEEEPLPTPPPEAPKKKEKEKEKKKRKSRKE